MTRNARHIKSTQICRFCRRCEKKFIAFTVGTKICEECLKESRKQANLKRRKQNPSLVTPKYAGRFPHKKKEIKELVFRPSIWDNQEALNAILTLQSKGELTLPLAQIRKRFGQNKIESLKRLALGNNRYFIKTCQDCNREMIAHWNVKRCATCQIKRLHILNRGYQKRKLYKQNNLV